MIRSYLRFNAKLIPLNVALAAFCLMYHYQP